VPSCCLNGSYAPSCHKAKHGPTSSSAPYLSLTSLFPLLIAIQYPLSFSQCLEEPESSVAAAKALVLFEIYFFVLISYQLLFLLFFLFSFRLMLIQ